MKDTKEMIKVMKAFAKGEKIECRYLTGKNSDEWELTPGPIWNWGKFDYRIKPKEPEIDWSKVPKDTPVLVRDTEATPWKPAYFKGCKANGRYLCYPRGKSSRTAGTDTSATPWAKCKLDPSTHSIINWLPNTGEEPKGNWVAELTNGMLYNKQADIVTSWSLTCRNPVVRYFLLP